MIDPDERARIETALVWYDRVIAGDERTGHTAVFAKAARLLLMRSAMTPDTLAPDIPWLLAVGFLEADPRYYSPRPARRGAFHRVCYDSRNAAWSIEGSPMPTMDTRDEVRALCAVLKILLTENPTS